MTVFRRPEAAAAAGDPIPFVHDGTMHLFYLASPPGTRDYPERVRTTWRHAVSTDLRDWREPAAALEPGPAGSYDSGGVWTGSVVEKDGVFHLFYTGHDPHATNPQTICLATSRDLVSFERHPANPLIRPVAGYEPVDWRDPYVFFNEDEGVWWMLITARTDHGPRWRRGCVVLATSPDLVNWSVEREPLYASGTTFCPECPELWPLDGRWYLVYSRFSERAGTVYRVADSPRGPFRTPVREELGGRRWYAAKSAAWSNGRVFFGWVHDVAEHADGSRRWLWGGDFALPRTVAAAETPEGPVLRVAPAVALAHGDPVGRVSAEPVATGGYSETDLPHPPGRALIDVAFTTDGAAAVGLDLVDSHTEESIRILLDLRRHEVTLTSEPRPLDDFWADLTGHTGRYREVDGPVLDRAALSPEATTGTHRVRVLLDRDVVEVYVDDDVALTHRVRRAERERLSAFVLDGDARVEARVSELREDAGAV